jgi:hypothetical protein
MTERNPIFYAHPQATAIETFLPILHPQLPHSNSIYNRLQAPHNTPSRHCLFAATFPPDSPTVPELCTIIFADRSRHAESQIWVFNSLVTNSPSSALSQTQQETLKAHLTSLILYLKDIHIPEAPGWPFSPILRFANLHESITAAFIEITRENDAMPYITHWNHWNISISEFSSTAKQKRPLPEGFTVDRIPEEQLDVVLETSAIKRQASTMLMLPNVGISNAEGKLIAWGYIGIDGSFATLYVLPEYRGMGLASLVAVELLGRLNKGEFADWGYHGKSGWTHSDVRDGNRESEGVMKSLGGNVGWSSNYVWVDSAKF